LKRRIFSVLTLIILLLSFVIFWSGSDYLVGRMVKIFTDEQAFSNALRLNIFNETIVLIKQNFFFGVGIGGFAYANYGYDINQYPHNLFLESLVEGGIVGFILFSLSIGTLFYLGYLYRKNLILTSYFAAALFLLLNYCKSGGFVGARDLFLFCGLMLATFQIRDKIATTN
jgi:O-antigen ligase